MAIYAGDTDNVITSSETIAEEIREYESLPNESVKIDVLKWWNSDKFPNLSMLARFIFAIPSSSSAPEQNFLTAGYIISERRNRLSSSTVESILICNSNADIEISEGNSNFHESIEIQWNVE